MRSSIRHTGPAVALLVGVALTAATRPLTTLAHLDFLTDRVGVTDTAAHSMYKLAADPKVGVQWVYANVESDGTFTRVGGGDYNPLKNTYGQGAFDTDDIARAAVVYLRQWQATGEEKAKDQAYQLLRGLTYLQTLTGPKAGEVVLWMQPDGTVNPSPLQPDSPNPSDSDASYWLARTLWRSAKATPPSATPPPPSPRSSKPVWTCPSPRCNGTSWAGSAPPRSSTA